MTFHVLKQRKCSWGLKCSLIGLISFIAMPLYADQPSSYAPVVIKEDFSTIMKRMQEEKPEIMQRHMSLLEERYDLSNKPSKVTMSKGKPLQEGVRVKLSNGMTW